MDDQFNSDPIPAETSAATHIGTCFCGAIEIAFTGTPLEMGYCHCASCRAHSGDPFATFILWRAGDVRVARGETFLGGYNKSGMSLRRFCTRCGGQLHTEHPGMGLTDVRAGILPTVAFAPSVHLNYAEAVMPVRDGLTKLRDFPADAGGTGEMVPE